MLRISLGCLLAAGIADAFAPSSFLALRDGLRPSLVSRQSRRAVGAALGLKCQIITNPNDGWKPDHQKQGAFTGNTDTGDYFEDAVKEESDLGFKSGAAATGPSQTSKLASMISADKTEIRTVEKLKYNVEFKPHKWRIDGDFAKDPKYALKFNTAEGKVSTSISVAPNSMAYEDFVAGFSADSAPGWEVSPREGTLERKGGPEQEFTVTYKGPQDKEDKMGTLVIVLPNDNWSWTYKFKVSFPA